MATCESCMQQLLSLSFSFLLISLRTFRRRLFFFLTIGWQISASGVLNFCNTDHLDHLLIYSLINDVKPGISQ